MSRITILRCHRRRASGSGSRAAAMVSGSRVRGLMGSVGEVGEGLAVGSSDSKIDEGARSPRTREVSAEGLLLR